MENDLLRREDRKRVNAGHLQSAKPWQETMLFLALSQSCNKPTVTPAWNFSNYSTYFPHFSSLRSDFRPLVEPKRDNWTNTGFFWSFTTFILGQELQDKMFWYLSTAGKYAACGRIFSVFDTLPNFVSVITREIPKKLYEKWLIEIQISWVLPRSVEPSWNI